LTGQPRTFTTVASSDSVKVLALDKAKLVAVDPETWKS